MNLNPGSVSGKFSYVINGSGVAAPLAVTAAQVRGSGERVNPEVVNLNHQNSMDGSAVSQFGGRGPSGVSAYGGNVGQSGLPGERGGTFGYGGGGQGPPVGHLQDPLDSNLGSGLGLSSYGGIGGGSQLLTSYKSSSLGGASGVFSSGYGGSLFGGLGASRGGTHSDGGAGLGTSFSASRGEMGNSGLAGLGIGFGDTTPRSYYGLSIGSLRMSYEGYQESAHYSLSSGSADQAHQQHKRYLGTSYK